MKGPSPYGPNARVGVIVRRGQRGLGGYEYFVRVGGRTVSKGDARTPETIGKRVAEAIQFLLPKET